MSDHFILMSEFLRYSGEKGEMKKSRRMGQGSVKLLNAKLLCTDWSQCLESDDVEFVVQFKMELQ